MCIWRPWPCIMVRSRILYDEYGTLTFADLIRAFDAWDGSDDTRSVETVQNLDL
jgi:hypothetical protein